MSKPQLSHVQLSSEAEAFISSAIPFWKPDESAEFCEKCFKKFSFTIRRHHCRDCGGIFCADCTPHRIPLAYRAVGAATPGASIGSSGITNVNQLLPRPTISNEKQRVCNYCWFFIDMHQKQEHDRANEARRMQLRAQDEGFMRKMAEGASGGTMQELRKHMGKELLGRHRAALGPRGTRSIAATSTKWSGSDDDGDTWDVRKYSDVPEILTKPKSSEVCFRDLIVEVPKQWQASIKKPQQNSLKETFMSAIPRLPAPALGIFLELSDKCGVNLQINGNDPTGQAVIAAQQSSRGVAHYYHKVTDDNLMDENSLVGVAAYFRT